MAQYISQSQVAEILKSTPDRASRLNVIQGLQSRGYQLEGYNDTAQKIGENKGVGQKIAGFFGMEKLGEGIAQTAYNASGGTKGLEDSQNKNLELASTLQARIKTDKASGKDTTHLEKTLNDLNDSLQEGAHQIGETGTGGLSNRDVLGSAAQTAVNIASAGSYGAAAEGAETGVLARETPNLLGGANKSKGIIKGAIEGAKKAALPGAATGAASAVANDIGSNNDLSAGGITKDIVGGGLGGGLLAGALGTVEGGIGGYVRNKKAVSAALEKSLTENPELVAKYGLSDTGKVVKDKSASKLIEGGVPEQYVAVAKNASEADKGRFKQMLALAESGSKDARQVSRASDVPGATFLRRLSHLKDTMQGAGKEIDSAAEGLKGKAVKGGTALVSDFENELQKSGVSIANGKLDFKGSDFEDLGDVEKAIDRVYTRLKGAGDDAYGLHRAKRYIDEVVDYGNSETGLRGSAKNLLKGVRHKADALLDGQFATYDKANTKYKDSIGALDEAGSLMGSRFNLKDINSEFSKMKAGSVMRRILGNGASRADLLQSIQKVEGTAKKYGFKGKEDIVSQVVFSDLLEKLFGTQATTGLQGQVTRAIEGVGGRLAHGDLKGAAGAALGHVLQNSRGLSQDEQILALKKLIGG